MNARTLAIAALAIAGWMAGYLVLPLFPERALALPWFGPVLVVIGGALGVPMVLGSIGSSGNHRLVVRLWPAIGAVAIVLVAAGAAGSAVSLGHSAVSGPGILVMAFGAGLLLGLAVVKWAIRQQRQR